MTNILSSKVLGAVAFCTLLALSACSNGPSVKKTKSEKEVFDFAQTALRSEGWERAIEYLGLLEEFYPFGLYAEQAQLELIYAYYRNGDFEQSIAAADRFIRLHPQHRSADYAYYMRGVASYVQDSAIGSYTPIDITQRDIGTARDSFNYFSQFLSAYPSSRYALDAQKRMIFLRNVMARSEINVANYYFKREAYLAAANRGRFVVENFQGTPAVPDGLASMAMAYFMLDNQALADQAAEILLLNYPNHPVISNGEFNFNFSDVKSRGLLSYVTFGLFDKRPTIKFDTRKLYDPFYTQSNFGAVEPPEDE